MRTAGIFLAIALSVIPVAGASSCTPVQFAGLAFISEHQDVDSSFPFSKKIVDQSLSGGESLDRALWRKINTVENPSFDLVFDRLADLNRSDSAIALAITLDRETVATERIGNTYKLLVDISAQALFFDFKQASIILSYPVEIENISAYQELPTDQQKLEAVREIISGEGGLSESVAGVLKKISLRPKVGARLGIRSVSIDPSALAVMSPALRDNARRAEIMIAQQFSNFLVKNQNVSVLPFTAGEAIGNRMSTRFSNGQIFNLRVPEADFAFDLTLKGFKKVQYQESVAAGSSWVYGSFVNVVLLEPLSGREFFSETLKNGEVKLVPSTQTNVDDWPSYQESLLGLFNKLTLAFSNSTDGWLIHATNDKNIYQKMTSANKVINQCKE